MVLNLSKMYRKKDHKYKVQEANKRWDKEVKFKINSDDMPLDESIEFAKYLRGFGYTVKRTVYHSPTKLMSWSTFTITWTAKIDWDKHTWLINNFLCRFNMTDPNYFAK
jgi:hypothetical protein